MYKLSAFLVIMLLLCGCSATDKNPAETPADSLPQTTAEPLYTFQGYLAEHLPPFTFDIIEKEITEFREYKYIITVSCQELPGYTPQTIEVISNFMWGTKDHEQCIALIDIDFDGFADIQAATAAGTVNIAYLFYRWDESSDNGYGGFEEKPFFDLVTTGYDLYPDTKQIISSSRATAMNHPREMYQLTDTQNGGKYVLIRTEAEELDKDNNIIARVFFGDEEIYRYNWLEGFENGQAAIADNYLRFGVADPIDEETARRLLHTEYSATDSKLGFRFELEEMILREKQSCYVFGVQWLLGNNHWTMPDYVGVSPDGRIFYK